MNIFLDTNILLDYLLEREPYCKDSYDAIKASLEDRRPLHLSASCITDIFYISRRYGIDIYETCKQINNILTFVDIVDVTKSDILKALSSIKNNENTKCNDFEDTLQEQCAENIRADYIITRDEEFINSSAKAISPAEYMTTFQ
jgi:predicted nucleic acid-binding protein